MELGIRFSENLPVAQIAVVRLIDLADGFFLDGDALHGFDGHDGTHANAASRLDDLAQRRGFNVVVDDARDMLLPDGANGQPQLMAEGFAGVPRIGRLKGNRMGNLLLEFLWRQVTAVRLRKCQAVFIDGVAVRTLDFGDAVAAARKERNHVNPETILHAAAGDGASGFLGKRVEPIDLRGGRRPWVDGFLTGGDDVDAAANALFDMVIDIADKAEQGHNRNVRVALIQHAVRILTDDDAGFDAQSGEIADVLPDDFRIDVDCADNLRAMFMQIAQNILAHLTASILNDFDFFHRKSPLHDIA